MQINAGETFTDTTPGNEVDFVRLNNHVNGAELLNGAVIDQNDVGTRTAQPATLGEDICLLGDSTQPNTAMPLKVTLANLLPEAIRLGAQQFVATDTGAANTYSVALSPAATTYTAGMVVRFKAAHANTGASTLVLNGIGSPGAQTIVNRDGSALTANDILAGQVVELVYDGTNFQLIGSRQVSMSIYAADAGTVNTYAVALLPAVGYTAGQEVRMKVLNTNTGASTLNVNFAGAKAIVTSAGLALAAGALVAGHLVTLVYNGTSFELQGNFWDYVGGGVPTTDAPPGSGTYRDYAHGLGIMPTKVRVVLVQMNAIAQQGYAQNTELDIATVCAPFGASNVPSPAFIVSANATNVRISQVNTAQLIVIPAGGGAFANITSGYLAIKVYASA